MTTTSKAPRSAYQITFGFSESSAITTGTTVAGFAAADAILTAAAADAPKGGAYDKTDVTIRHLPTGETYRLRYDVRHASEETPDLRARVIHFCEWIANSGKWGGQAERQEAATWIARLSA